MLPPTAAPWPEQAAPGPPEREPRRRSSRVRTGALLVVGGLLLALLLYHTGIGPVVECLHVLGWKAPLVLVPYLVIAYLDARGWACTLPARTRVPIRALYAMRIAGEAANTIGAVGGEPVKAYLLQTRGVAASDSVASILIAKTALTVAQILFVLLGVAALLRFLGLPTLGIAWIVVALLVASAIGIGLVRLQRSGPAAWMWRWLQRVAPRARWVARTEGGAVAVDRRLAQYYGRERGAFCRATLWHFAAWLGGVFEVQIMMALIGHPIALPEAFIIETLAQPIRATAIVFPGALGTQELGGVAVCRLLDIPDGPALTLWLLKRARETLFDGAGLLYLLQQTARRPSR